MKPLDPAKNELKKAKNYIEVMKVSKSLDKFEDNWKNYLHKMEITQKDDKLTINTNSPIHVTFFPEKVVLVDVVNRGRTYSVPLKHLGKKLKNASPIDIAERGYEFYEKFINEAEEYFCKQSIV